jgi:hypothetical protein
MVRKPKNKDNEKKKIGIELDFMAWTYTAVGIARCRHAISAKELP